MMKLMSEFLDGGHDVISRILAENCCHLLSEHEARLPDPAWSASRSAGSWSLVLCYSCFISQFPRFDHSTAHFANDFGWTPRWN